MTQATTHRVPKQRIVHLLAAAAVTNVLIAPVSALAPDPDSARAHRNYDARIERNHGLVAVQPGALQVRALDGLRADAVGALTPDGSLGSGSSATPHLDRFIATARENGWAGAAIAPSSWSVPSTASLVPAGHTAHDLEFGRRHPLGQS